MRGAGRREVPGVETREGVAKTDLVSDGLEHFVIRTRPHDLTARPPPPPLPLPFFSPSLDTGRFLVALIGLVPILRCEVSVLVRIGVILL